MKFGYFGLTYIIRRIKMNLGEYITILKNLDPNIKLKYGLGKGHCWEQNPHELEFKIINDITIREMLKHAKLINNSYITAINDNEHLMNEFTTIHIENKNSIIEVMFIKSNRIKTEKQKINEFNTFVENIKEKGNKEMLTSKNTDINKFLYPKNEKTNIISKELWKTIQTEAQNSINNIENENTKYKESLINYYKLIDNFSINNNADWSDYKYWNQIQKHLKHVNEFYKNFIKKSTLFKHWQSIVDGGIPSGYVIEEDIEEE
jgi:hypothetical protein